MRAVRRFRYLLFFALLMCCRPTDLSGQQNEKQFKNISVEKGLSQSTVFSITQDTLGFMWMATKDGLNRFDGTRFKVYRPQAGQAAQIASSYISYLYVDKAGHLWVGGNQGISRYNYDTDNFDNFSLSRTPGEWSVSSILEDPSGNLWASSTGGDVFIKTKGETAFKPINIDMRAYGIKHILSIGWWNNAIILGTEVGLYRVAATAQQLENIPLGINKPEINTIYTSDDVVYIGTEGQGLISLNKQTGALHNYKHLVGLNTLVDNNVRTICEDKAGNLWLGTLRGLSVYDPKTKVFSTYIHDLARPFALSQNSVRCIFRDRQQGMWLGTYYGGVNYYHENHIRFNLLSRNTGPIALNDEVVSVIKEDKQGDIWIGANDKGLNYWNRRSNKMQYYVAKEGDPNSLNTNNIKSLVFGDDDKVLIGTHNGGLNILNRTTGLVSHHIHQEQNPQSIASNLVYSLLKDSKERIWVGTYAGLDQFDLKTGVFRHVLIDHAGSRLSSNEITYLFEDSKKRIWIGTTSGVAQFYPDNMLFGLLPHARLAEDMINCIVEDNKHRIWIGTRRGISLYDEKKRDFVTYEQRNDFIGGTVYGILPDPDGNLWISTNHGLVQFNPDKGTMNTFDEKDGLQNNQFNEYSFCSTSDGTLFFGGIKGISYFKPNWLRQAPVQLQLRFTGLEVLGKTIVVQDGTHILSQSMDQTDRIVLGPEHKQFSLYFNSFNYLSANRTYYMYKLDGIDSTWQKTEDPKVSYSNLPAGTYQFLVKSVGPNGEESKTRALIINIEPLWYKSTLFYVVFVGVLLGLAYLAYRIISERIRTRNQLKAERLDKERVQYINQMKMDFFTNISHELRTPLTLLLAPLEEMLGRANPDKWLRKQQELMQVNAKRLYQLVDQLFEFKKTEQGTRKLQVTRADLISFVRDIYTSFKPLAEKNSIHFIYEPSEQELDTLFDPDALEKILFNLLSNAFKYTKAGETVSIKLCIQDDYVNLVVSDTGIGIAQDQLEKIFERFYQVEGAGANLGSGVGLAFTKRLVELHHGRIYAQSTVGQGSRFVVELPLSDQFYAGDIRTGTPDPVVEVIASAQEETANLHQDDKQDRHKAFHDARILLVDDNEHILSYLRGLLEDNFHIDTAADGQLALQYLENNPYDLVISDVMMPNLDGLHLCKRIKQNIKTSHIPVILLTAKSDDSQQLKGLEMGADDYISKPFSPKLLQARMYNMLKSRKRLKDYYAESKEIMPENITFNPLDEAFLKDAIAIIEKHLSDSDFSIEKFSREIGMSRSNLYLKFKAITGESASDFIKRIRFTKSVELIKSKQYTMAQIAYMCGFNSPSYFSAAFRQYYGRMPSEYLE